MVVWWDSMVLFLKVRCVEGHSRCMTFMQVSAICILLSRVECVLKRVLVARTRPISLRSRHDLCLAFHGQLLIERALKSERGARCIHAHAQAFLQSLLVLSQVLAQTSRANSTRSTPRSRCQTTQLIWRPTHLVTRWRRCL